MRAILAEMVLPEGRVGLGPLLTAAAGLTGLSEEEHATSGQTLGRVVGEAVEFDWPPHQRSLTRCCSGDSLPRLSAGNGRIPKAAVRPD